MKEKIAEIIKELFRYPNDFEVQKITLILNNHEKNIRSFEIDGDDILQLGGILGFNTLIIRMYNEEIPKKAEKFFASGNKRDILTVKVEATKKDATYYFAFWTTAIAKDKDNILAHFTDTLIMF